MTTRPESDPANLTLSTEDSDRTGAASSTTTMVVSTSSSSTTITTSSDTISSLTLLATTTASSTFLSSTFATSTTSSPLLVSTSGSIVWRPETTASPLVSTGSSGDAVTATAFSTSQSETANFSHGQKVATICSTVIGGLFVLLLLAYALYQRRKGATMSEIMRFRPHRPRTIILDSPFPKDRLTALPIYHTTRYSVRSSMHALQISAPSPTAGVPANVAKRFHQQNPYAKNTWNISTGPATPPPTQTPMRQSTFLADPTPESSPEQPRKIPVVRTAAVDRMHSFRSHRTQSSDDSTKSLVISVKVGEADEPVTPILDSPGYQHGPDQSRWSWTNSNAPATPRYASSTRSSWSSLPRLRSIKSWVRGQSERIVEEPAPAMPSLTTKRLLMKNNTLKNQASKPRLAPPAFGGAGGHARVGSLSSIFRQHPGTKIPMPGSPAIVKEQWRPMTVPEGTVLEMSQQSR